MCTAETQAGHSQGDGFRLIGLLQVHFGGRVVCRGKYASCHTGDGR